ncbi:ABC transporter substrate-binding protein [bacterium]|nr:ABC transporter substrate-binding protein [bacterium]
MRRLQSLIDFIGKGNYTRDTITPPMWSVIKRLLLGLILITIASSVLLLSDLHHRKSSSKPTKKWRILLTLLVEAPPMEEAHQGMMEGLRQSGLVEGQDFEVVVRNAQGDMPTLNSILDTAAVEKTDMIFTITTPALQTAVNKIKNKPIVFSLAVNPSSWGGSKNDQDHTPNMTGVYVSSPFQKMIDVIRECFPKARRIGTLFSPGEANSVYVKDLFTTLVQKNGLELVVLPVNSSVEISEAAASLIGRGIDVFCQIGDNASSAGFPSIVLAARESKIPLFCFSTFQARQGALISVSNDHFDSGREAALLAVRIMRGESPASIPLQPARTVKVAVNTKVAKENGYTLPDALVNSADEIIGEKVKERSLSKKWNIQLVEYSNILDVEDSEKGIRDGFKKAGLMEGRDYTLKVRNAQGDMVTLSTMIDSAVSEGADLLMTMSTPTLQAAIKRAGKRPIVFTLVASAVAAGAGKSNEDHLPNVTGVLTTSAYEELVAVIRESMPHAKRIGTLFVPSEINSVYNMEQTAKAASKSGMQLITVPANTSGDVSDASLSLMSQRIDAVCQIAGNLTAFAFPSLVQASQRSRLPIFAFQTNQAYEGASIVVARDYYDGGLDAAEIATRIMRGESPAKIPFQPLRTTRLLVNQKAAAQCGLKIPETILKRAEKIIGE